MLPDLIQTYFARFGLMRAMTLAVALPMIFVTVLSLGWAVGALRAPGMVRQAAFTAALFAIGGMALDWALLSLLSRLGLSFGPVRLSFFCLAMVRMSLLLTWGLLGMNARTLPVLGLAQALIIGGVVYGFYIEPFNLQVTHLEFPARGIRPGERLRILQLSDLHVERWTRREADLLERAAELEPDLIVMTGDFLNLSYLSDERAWEDLRRLARQLSASYGVYAVDGSVDNPENLHRLLEGTRVQVLDDQILPVSTPAGDVLLVGLSNTGRERDRQQLLHLAEELPGGSARPASVLLYHTPDLVETARQAGIDFYFAGHTHGGQIRLPLYGAVYTSSIYGKRYEAGLYPVGPTRLYVSRGIGLEGSEAPRARFLCPPEMVVIDLISEQK